MINYLKKRKMMEIVRQLYDDVPTGKWCNYGFNRGYESLSFYVGDFERVTISHYVNSKVLIFYTEDYSLLGVAKLLSKRVISGSEYEKFIAS